MRAEVTQNRNREFHERALKVLPGPNSNLRLPAVVEPVYMVEAHGARFRDVNGKEYIDYGHGGQGILGHGNKEYTATLQKQLDKLFYVHTGEFRTTLEVELAEKMAELVSSRSGKDQVLCLWDRGCPARHQARQGLYKKERVCAL